MLQLMKSMINNINENSRGSFISTKVTFFKKVLYGSNIWWRRFVPKAERRRLSKLI